MKGPSLVIGLLATDPGAWKIIGWILVVGAVGAVVLWVATTLLLRDGSTHVPEEGKSAPV